MAQPEHAIRLGNKSEQTDTYIIPLMDLKSLTVSERSQTQKAICSSGKDKTTATKIAPVISGCQRWGVGERN